MSHRIIATQYLLAADSPRRVCSETLQLDLGAIVMFTTLTFVNSI